MFLIYVIGYFSSFGSANTRVDSLVSVLKRFENDETLKQGISAPELIFK